MTTRTANGTIQFQAIGNIVNSITGEDGDPKATWGDTLDAIKFLTGVEDNQINRGLSKKDVVIASGGSLTLDMYDFAGFDAGGGDGKDQLGQALAINNVALIFIRLHPGSDGQLQIGNEGSGAAWNSLFSGRDDAAIPLRASSTLPGIFFILVPHATALEVTDVTNHLLKLSAVGGDVTVDLHFGMRDIP